MKLAFKFDDGRTVAHEVFERTFTLGRSEKCRLTLDSEGFSREHCLIELVDGKLYLTDLGSKNGIYINHVRIPQKLRVSYDPQLPLYIGDAFVTIDFSKDLKSPDHLSLVTQVHVAPDEIYRRAMNRKLTKRVEPIQEPPKKSALPAIFVLAAIAGGLLFYQVNKVSAQHRADAKAKAK